MTSYRPFLLLIYLILTSCQSNQKRDPTNYFDMKIGDEAPIAVPSFDGFVLNTVIELPSGVSPAEVRRVVVFAHGSGPQNADGDLSAISVPAGTENLIYRDLARGMQGEGFATVRYNKRSFEARQRLLREPNYAKSPEFQKYSQNVLQYFLNDFKHMTKEARLLFPNAKIYALGHSEGTGLALWAASELNFISGVVLIGFANERQSSLLYEQLVYRSYFSAFRKVDRNKDDKLDRAELRANTEIAKTILAQLDRIDLDGSGEIDLSEFLGASYSNSFLLPGLYDPGYQMGEAALPRPSTIIQTASFKILFLQGEFDNQTPSFHTKAVEVANRLSWKKENLRFRYFPGKGHALDPRNDQWDLGYRPLEAATLKKIATEMTEFFD